MGGKKPDSLKRLAIVCTARLLRETMMKDYKMILIKKKMPANLERYLQRGGGEVFKNKDIFRPNVTELTKM